MQASAAPVLTQAGLDAACYRTVLERWKRCHAENAALAAELRADDARSRARLLLRLLWRRHDASLQMALRTWVLHATRIAAAHALRCEAGARKELEAQLELAREGERAMRVWWESEQQRKQEQEQEELALVAQLQARGALCSHGGPASSAAAAPPLPPAPPAAPFLEPAAALPAAPAERLGSRAELLLAAWRNENGAPGHDPSVR